MVLSFLGHCSKDNPVVVLTFLIAYCRYFPVGIVFLLAVRVVDTEDPVVALRQLGYYALTVLVGLIIHTLITLPLIYTIILRKNPLLLLHKAAPALLTVFGTGSR